MSVFEREPRRQAGPASRLDSWAFLVILTNADDQNGDQTPDAHVASCQRSSHRRGTTSKALSYDLSSHPALRLLKQSPVSARFLNGGVGTE